ncbi:von Willebrand factor type A domain-containing protein [Rhodovulum bhavnagarense]|uniref:von Willebrand factor type A domain-containing protein n=1 Tax=Rhodovulum bhavnagarense TaxID=992286 RepID=A0A4R2RAI0_9RHOB|nr:nitric oxide reductase activation protein NorD [Rhodovulum bhavnagarense]TCP60292.1 von Willebrand factor type A domain-containing protein [Rhodovulum bhavnagarense]
MSFALEDHAELTDELDAAQREILEQCWLDAIRVLSPRGLDNWLKGAVALAHMGRGDHIVRTWIEVVPILARDLGEDVIPDLAQACLGFASRTSGAVIERVIATAPVASRRLSDPDLFRTYLQFLNQLLAQAPRGLRPMLEHLEELLDVLTLGGLRRWANWGAQAHRTNFEEMTRYFSLESAESQAILQNERKGTLFVDIHRRIGMYLRALWGRDFLMRPTAGDFETREGAKPYIAEFFLHLPDAYDDWNGEPGLDLYRAAAAHAAAHVALTTAAIPGDELNALQQQCVGLIEDARIEALAIAQFPRLRDLWRKFHAPSTDGTMGAQFDRIALGLLDPEAQIDDPVVDWVRDAFAKADLSDAAMSRELGLHLAHQLRNRPFSAYRDVQGAPYRDDNRYIWEFEQIDWEKGFAPAPEQVRKYVTVSEMVNEVEVETAGDDAQEIWVSETEFFDDDGLSFNEKEGKEPTSPPVPYDEFDYKIQMHRPSWATVLEKRPKLGDPAEVDAILTENRKLTQRMRHLLDAMQPQGVQRIRKLEDGDEIDINAALQAMVDIRMGQQPDPRIMMRSVRKVRDIAVMTLLDLSESTNDQVAGQDQTVLDLTKAATVLLAEAIAKVGDAFALHGFCSDGRHNVFYQRYKDFDQRWDEMPKARLAGMQGQLSTRMGAAIRHAGHHLAQVPAAKKLMLVITDGAPADIDERDPQYLRQDARAAVLEVEKHGVIPFCLTLDPRADQYVAQIFGQRNFFILDNVERLPERLPQLYAGLTR